MPNDVLDLNDGRGTLEKLNESLNNENEKIEETIPEEVKLEDKENDDKVLKLVDEDVEEDDNKKGDEEKKDDEEEEEIYGKDDADDDELVFDNVPRRQEIEKTFPGFFKKFPSVEKVIYREQAFAEQFASPKEAAAARMMLSDYQQLEGALRNGSTNELFDGIKKNAPESFDKITDNLLETLHKVDKSAAERIITKVVKNSLINAFTHAEANDDDQLKIAAQLLHKAIFNSTNINAKLESPNENKPTNQTEEQKRFEFERQRFYGQQIQTHVQEVGDRTSNVVRNTIEKYIDPKSVMSEYVKDKAVNDAYKLVEESINKDRRFQQHLNRLWQSAAAENFSSASKDKIRNALLAKAKSGLDGILRNVRQSALKGYKTRGKDANDDNDKSLVARGNSTRGGERVVDKPKLTRDKVNETRGMSTKEILDKLHG